LPSIQEAGIRDRPPDVEVDRRSVVRKSKEVSTSNSQAPPATEHVIDTYTKEGNEQQHRDPERTAPAISVSAEMREHTNTPRTTSHSQAVREDVSNQPSRGRRPPTPYHAPSNLALTEISESGSGERLGKGGDSVSDSLSLRCCYFSIDHLLWFSMDSLRNISKYSRA
jgi:hypothetical protein